MKIYLYLPLGSGTMHYEHARDQIAKGSMQLRSPYDTIFYTEGLYVNADVYQKADNGKRLQYAGDRQSFTSYQRIEVAGLTISREEKTF